MARREPLRTTAVNLGELVRNMADLFGATTGPSIHLLTDVPDELPQVLAEANQLEMAVLNLAVNGRDVPPHDGTLTIAADHLKIEADAALAPGDNFRRSRSDTGTGMETETLS